MKTIFPAKVIEEADRVVFPGVGAIRDCMCEINQLKLQDVLGKAISQKPVLAICVGMQGLMTHSEENGGVDCLNFLPGKVKFFGNGIVDAQNNTFKVPHMGWNNIDAKKNHPVFNDIKSSDYYFVHSYKFSPLDKETIISSTNYGEDFASSLGKDNILGTQFHPEKSQAAGVNLLKNFIEWSP